MSYYGLIKAESRIMRNDTIADLARINHWLWTNGLPAIQCYGQSVRALENSVALGLERINVEGLPHLVRSYEFYKSILPEIKDKERKKFNFINNHQIPFTHS